MSSPTRQLAAIMFTDIVGYTALMGKDSKKALDLVRKSKEIQKPLVEKYNGKWLKEMGDGAMASFSTALDAVNCAVEIQELARVKFEAKIRIGIHLGDITIENEDIYGDGVNIASRIESIADPGGIYITDAVEKAIRGQSNVQTKYLGELQLKNVDYAVRTYALQGSGLPIPIFKGKNQSTSEKKKPLTRIYISAILVSVIVIIYLFLGYNPDYSEESESLGKSVAVLAFADMSPNKDQEYFCDGISEEIINNLVQIKELKVIGRSSSFQFKGQNPDHRVVGEKLGVSTFLEGSIRKSGNKIRVTAQLINAQDGTHVWSETFDRDLDDIFKIQDEISQGIAEQLKVSFGLSKTKKVNLDIYDIYLQAKTLLNQRGEAVDRAIALFEDILELDSTYQPAWTGLAQAWTVNSLYKVSSSEESHGLIFEQSLDLAENAARRALELEPEDPESLAAMATIYRDRGQWGIAYDYYKRAYSLNGKSPIILEDYVQFLTAVGYVTKSLELSNILITLDPLTPLYITWHGNTLRLNKELGASLNMYKKSNKVDPNFLFSDVGLLKIYLQLDHLDSALDLVNNSLAFGQARKTNYSSQIKADQENNRTFDFSQIPPELRLIYAIIALDNKDLLMETVKGKTPGSSIFGFSYWDIYSAIIYGYANDTWFKEAIKDSGLVEFWKENDWPAYCKPVGDNDFVWE